MRQVYINTLEKVGSTDINNLQLAMHQSLFDDTLYNLFNKPAYGVLRGGFLASYTSALAASLASGTGFYYDSSQTGYNPKFRMVTSSGNIAVTFTAANTSDRIDLVCLAPNFVVTATAQRYVKVGGTGPVALQTINKLLQDSYTLHVVAGTPSGSPVAPSIPSGYIPIATAYIHANTGMAGQADITDLRTLLSASSVSIVAVAANFNINIGVGVYLATPPNTGGIFGTLPLAASSPNAIVTVKNAQVQTGFSVTVNPSGSDLVEGLNSGALIEPGDTGKFASDGVSNWWSLV